MTVAGGSVEGFLGWKPGERWSGPPRVLGPSGGVAMTVTGAMGARRSVRAVWGVGGDSDCVTLSGLKELW